MTFKRRRLRLYRRCLVCKFRSYVRILHKAVFQKNERTNMSQKTKIIITTNLYVDVYDDVIKWKHFPRYWPFVQGIHLSPVNSPQKGQWHGALTFTLICALNKRSIKQSWGPFLIITEVFFERHEKVNRIWINRSIIYIYIHSFISFAFLYIISFVYLCIFWSLLYECSLLD